MLGYALGMAAGLSGHDAYIYALAWDRPPDGSWDLAGILVPSCSASPRCLLCSLADRRESRQGGDGGKEKGTEGRK
jgi:hypothetical protein